jgi:hypothetical protein
VRLRQEPRIARAGFSVLPIHNLLTSAVDVDDRLDIVLYGSLLDATVDSVDVDVWCRGPLEAIDRWKDRAQKGLGDTLLDVINPSALSNRPALERALLWCVSRGVVVGGKAPSSPPGMTYEDVCVIFRDSASESATALVNHARVLALAGQPTADGVGRVAVRAWLRSMAEGPIQSRAVRRMSDRAVAAALVKVAPRTGRALKKNLWSSTEVLDVVSELLRDQHQRTGA